MGGFGAFQLGGWAPDAFDVVISVAGYGLGTLEPESGSAQGLKGARRWWKNAKHMDHNIS